jgi:hypothetical protein
MMQPGAHLGKVWCERIRWYFDIATENITYTTEIDIENVLA